MPNTAPSMPGAGRPWSSVLAKMQNESALAAATPGTSSRDWLRAVWSASDPMLNTSRSSARNLSTNVGRADRVREAPLTEASTMPPASATTTARPTVATMPRRSWDFAHRPCAPTATDPLAPRTDAGRRRASRAGGCLHPPGTVPAVTKVLCPGSFDPIHNGHLEVIERAAHLFDEVVVAAMRNPQKGEPLFSLEEREAMIRESLSHLENVSFTMFSTLVVDLAREIEADFIVKGLRAVSDFESELQMAQMNHAISGVDTLFIPSASSHSFLASKLIREIARFGGDVASMVPEPVAKRLVDRFS